MTTMTADQHTAMDRALDDVHQERLDQHEKWGEQNHPDGTGGWNSGELADLARQITNRKADEARLTWKDILREEYLEAMAETDTAKLRTELVQVAAVATAWVEAIDRRS